MKKEETAEKEKKTTDGFILNADKHSPASSARSDCVHEQVAKRIANVRFTSGYYFLVR